MDTNRQVQSAVAIGEVNKRVLELVAVVYSAFASLLRTLAMLVEWRAAVQGAVVDADRFVRSARTLQRAWLEEYGESQFTRTLVAATAPIVELAEVELVGPVCRSIALVPLPIGIYPADTSRRIRIPRFDEQRDEKEAPPPELTVARSSGSISMANPRTTPTFSPLRKYMT